jgi:hypothetical protein
MVIGLAILAIPMTAAIPAAAAPASPPSLAAASMAQRPAPAVVPDNYPPASNTRTQFLTSNPTTLNETSCVTRTIFLATGLYLWKYFFNNQTIDVSGDPATLIMSGTYKWRDCLVPMFGYYVQSSSLTSIGFGNYYSNSAINIQVPRDGVYTWGSDLIPLF